VIRDFAMQASRVDAEHDARLDAEELALDLAAFDAWVERQAAQAQGDLVADYPHTDGLF
jgi:hypothetical protein